MSVQLTPSKRPHDRSVKEPNGKRKWQKSAGSISQNVPLKISPGSAAFRVLCPASKIGGVIGKGGRIISQIRRETGAKVKVEENVRGSDERVIVIMGSDKENEVDSERSNEDAEETNTAEEVDDAKERGEDDEDKQSVPAENLRSDKGTSSVEKALFLVFERIVEGELETDGGDKESDRSSTFVLRLLVLSSQVGCLLGKGGSVIKQMSSESGAQIRILPRDKLPSCASPADELVQVTGAPDAVRKALQSVSQQLLENPPRDNDMFSGNPSGPSSHSHGNPLSRSDVHPPPNYPFPAQGAPYGTGPRNGADYHLTTPPLISKFHESGIPGRVNLSPDILTFRIVCHDEVVGGVIGKGGTIVKSLQHETGCEIKVLDGVSDSEDRIIVISGPAHPDDGVSAPQDAVLRVQSRIYRASSDSKEKPIAKILVSSNQIGCLLGKGGSVIAEMRKSTGAHIRILGKDQLPKGASENEELVQINGEFETVQEALMQITARLRNHFFRDAFPSINFPSNPSFPDQVSSFPSYMGRREFSPPGMFSNRGLSFHKFDAVGGLPPHGAFHLHDERPFMHNIHGPGFPPHISERTSSAPWGPQGLIEGGGPIGLPDYAGAPQRRIGLGGVSHQAIITNTTVEVVVPRSLVPAIYGEDGGCLQQIREISDAKITITDPNPGATETAIIISGTPEQTHAAQSLIQAFVISEREGA